MLHRHTPSARGRLRSFFAHVLQLRPQLPARSLLDLGQQFAPGLYEAELRYLRETEWATTARDVLWRRSKLGLHVEPGTLENVTRDIDAWFARATTKQHA